MDPDFQRALGFLRQHSRTHRRVTGFVYFVGAHAPDGELEAVKIGWTKRGVEKRLAALRTGNHRRLELLGCEIGDQFGEAHLHEIYAELRLGGEWFAPAPPLLLHIARLEATDEWRVPVAKCESCQAWSAWMSA